MQGGLATGRVEPLWSNSAGVVVDHTGPRDGHRNRGVDIGPHLQVGLQTVTWLLMGEILHRGSRGSEQVIRPGQLNLMTVGHVVSHSDEATAYRANSSVDFDLRPGEIVIPRDAAFEHALVMFDRAVTIGDRVLEPGHLGYVGTARTKLRLRASAAARALLIFGAPFPEPVLMWWNYVASDRDDITTAHADWTVRSVRFGHAESPLWRVDVGPPSWTTGQRWAEPSVTASARMHRRCRMDVWPSAVRVAVLR